MSKPICMTIGPYGKDLAEEKIRQSLELVINKALGTKYEIKPFHATIQMVMDSDIFNGLIKSDLVVADLRGMNANVLYELGIRHAFNLKTIHMTDKETQLPWDIDKNFTIRYDAPIQACDVTELSKELTTREEIISAMHSDQSFNSFHNHVKMRANISQSEAPQDIKDFLIKMQNQMANMQSQLSTIHSQTKPVDLSTWGTHLFRTDVSGINNPTAELNAYTVTSAGDLLRNYKNEKAKK